MGGVTVQTEQVPKPNPPRLPSAEDELALRIKYERMKRRWSTEEVARRMTEAGYPLNQSAIWRIENATPRRKISLDEALGFAKVFGVDLGDLIGPPQDAILRQIAALIAKMRDTSDDLREQRRQLIQAVTAAAVAQAEPVDETVQFMEDLVREFPWIERPG